MKVFHGIALIQEHVPVAYDYDHEGTIVRARAVFGRYQLSFISVDGTWTKQSTVADVRVRNLFDPTERERVFPTVEAGIDYARLRHRQDMRRHGKVLKPAVEQKPLFEKDEPETGKTGTTR